MSVLWVLHVLPHHRVAGLRPPACTSDDLDGCTRDRSSSPLPLLGATPHMLTGGQDHQCSRTPGLSVTLPFIRPAPPSPQMLVTAICNTPWVPGLYTLPHQWHVVLAYTAHPHLHRVQQCGTGKGNPLCHSPLGFYSSPMNGRRTCT